MTLQDRSDKKIDRALRERALKMSDKGMSIKEIAKKLKVKPMTVAAWKAHRTMGSYDDE
jgi:uncharacterized protein YjcR